MEDAPFVVLKLEEDVCDEGHSTLTVHGDAQIVAGIATAVALMTAALAEELGGELFDPRELIGEPDAELFEIEPEADLAESA